MTRAIAEQAKHFPKPSGSQTPFPTSEVYIPPTVTESGFPNKLDPSKTGANRPFIQEDQAWIQQNLSHAARPLTPEEMAVEYQRRLAVSQQQNLVHQQMRTLREQEDLARAQRLAIQQSMASGGLFTPITTSPHFGELDKGAKSYLPAKKVESWPAKQAYAHWLEGQGQPVEVPFRIAAFCR